MADILKISLHRHDDISMLRQLLRTLYSKNEEQNVVDGSGSVSGGLMSERTRAMVAKVHSNEAHRQNQEDTTLRMIATTDTTGIQNELYQTITKLNQICKRHRILSSLMEIRASSQIHCISIMQSCYERAEPMGNTISLFSTIME